MSRLDTTQRWLTSIIIRPGRLSDKISAADKTYRLNSEEIIRSSAKLSVEKKIGIYARGYVLRLMECMEADYPLTKKLLGDELFKTFVHAYLVRIPPHSPSLFDLGNNFPEFLKASQPAAKEGNNMFDLPVELAEVERAKTEAGRSKGLEGTEPPLQQDDPLFCLLGSSIKASPCLRLLKLQFALLDFIKATERDEPAATPQKQITFLAVSRKNYSVIMQELEAWQWHYLRALAATGDQQQAVAVASAESAVPEEMIMADLLLWMPVALGNGYIFNAINEENNIDQGGC